MMLIISRRHGQSVIINHNVKVYFLGLNTYGQARFGIEAPKDVPVHREEIHKRIKQEAALRIKNSLGIRK